MTNFISSVLSEPVRLVRCDQWGSKTLRIADNSRHLPPVTICRRPTLRKSVKIQFVIVSPSNEFRTLRSLGARSGFMMGQTHLLPMKNRESQRCRRCLDLKKTDQCKLPVKSFIITVGHILRFCEWVFRQFRSGMQLADGLGVKTITFIRQYF